VGFDGLVFADALECSCQYCTTMLWGQGRKGCLQ
jgi:hypothetical protein